MRKKDKKERTTKIFLGFVLIIFLISSLGSVVVFYGDNSETDTIKLSYSGKEYEFKRSSDEAGNLFYTVKTKESEFTTYFLPSQLSLNINNQTQNLLINSNYFYLSFDPEQEDLSFIDYMRYDLRNNIPVNKFFIDAVVKDNEIYNFPVITCENATFNSPVVHLKNTNSTNVSYAENCLTIEFTSNNFLQVRDTLVYLSNNINIG